MRYPLLFALILALSAAACASEREGWSNADALRQCEADVGPRWLEHVDHIDSLLLLGRIHDPQSGRPIRPANGLRHLGGGLELWMSRTGLKRVDLYIEPGFLPENHIYFGPKVGQPTGIYAFERVSAGDPGCTEYNRTTAARSAVTPAIPPVIEGPYCVTYRYVGPLNLDHYQYIVLNYIDERALQHGYQRFVQELRRGETTPVARAVAYQFPLRVAAANTDAWPASARTGSARCRKSSLCSGCAGRAQAPFMRLAAPAARRRRHSATRALDGDAGNCARKISHFGASLFNMQRLLRPIGVSECVMQQVLRVACVGLSATG